MVKSFQQLNINFQPPKDTMNISKIGFVFFDSSFEDLAPLSPFLEKHTSLPDVKPRPPLPVPLSDNQEIPYSLLFHKRSELIKSLLWKTTPKRSKKKKPSNAKQKLRTAILNCPPEEMFSLLKENGLLNDDEPIPSSLPMKKKVLPSIPVLPKKN